MRVPRATPGDERGYCTTVRSRTAARMPKGGLFLGFGIVARGRGSFASRMHESCLGMRKIGRSFTALLHSVRDGPRHSSADFLCFPWFQCLSTVSPRCPKGITPLQFRAGTPFTDCRLWHGAAERLCSKSLAERGMRLSEARVYSLPCARLPMSAATPPHLSPLRLPASDIRPCSAPDRRPRRSGRCGRTGPARGWRSGWP